MELRKAVIHEIERELTPSRLLHTYSAEKLCSSLAKRFLLDLDAAWTAAMWHDSAREWGEERLIHYAESRSLETTALEKKVPMLLHAPAAAYRMVSDLGYDNPDAWNAVRWHTTGHPDMGRLGYALYVADFLEPGRTHITSKERAEILLLESLEQMMLEIYRRQFTYFASRDVSPEPASLQLYYQLRTMLE